MLKVLRETEFSTHYSGKQSRHGQRGIFSSQGMQLLMLVHNLILRDFDYLS